MKIKRVRCEQFAGIKDMDICFSDGLNILFGKNESGKSTMVEVLYHTLFQDIKLDKRTDKEFVNRYFPGETVEMHRGTAIDGTVYFETEQGEYRLTKEWDKDGGSCKLVTPEDAIIRNPEEVRNILKEILIYGKGIYHQVIFAPQIRQQAALMTLLSKTSEVKKDKKTDLDIREEILSGVTGAVMEYDGISVEKVEKKLEEMLKIYGSRWDFENNLPEGGRKHGVENPWKTGVGIILRLYYEKEQLAKEISDAELEEKEVEQAILDYQDILTKKQSADEEYEEFNAHYNVLANKVSTEQLAGNIKHQLEELKQASGLWPLEEKRFEKLKQVKKERKYNVLLDKQKKLEERKQCLEKLGDISEKVKDRTVYLCVELERLKNQAAGLNLSARLHMYGDYQGNVISGITGNVLDVKEEQFDITEPVVIRIPDVMDLQLSPKGTDMDELRGMLAKYEAELSDIFETYHVSGKEELIEQYHTCEKLRKEISQCELDYIQEQREGMQLSEMKKTVRSAEEVDRDIMELCGKESVDHMVGSLSAKLNGFREKYGTLEQLQRKIEETEKEYEGCRHKLNKIKNLPDQYRDITNPEEIINQLKQKKEMWEKRAEESRNRLEQAKIQRRNVSAEELGDELKELEERFLEAKNTYQRWKHIREVFDQVKRDTMNHPMKDIEENMGKYLSVLSEGKVSLQSMDDHMEVRIVSGKNYMTYDLLSEGTKDMISLAFRLAVIEHLYPEGEGFIILDDSFTEMDRERKSQACRLLEKFAEKNQVIFITCDENYETEMKGKMIRI